MMEGRQDENLKRAKSEDSESKSGDVEKAMGGGAVPAFKAFCHAKVGSAP